MAQQLLKKMSAKTICGNVKSLARVTFYKEKADKDGNLVLLEDAPKGIDLFRVIGVADGIKSGNSQFGDWISFTGNFKAIGLRPDENGEVDEYRSAVLFLPAPADQLLVEALKDNDNVELAFIIGISPSTGVLGYEYTCQPLIKPQENDAISSLEQKLGLAQLEAPKESEPEEVAKKSTAKKGK